MSTSFTLYKELFPPTTVEHVQRASFTSATATNVIVAKASLLQIYNFTEYEPEPEDDATDQNEPHSPPDERFDKDDDQVII